jgi:hypothetical protein
VRQSVPVHFICTSPYWAPGASCSSLIPDSPRLMPQWCIVLSVWLYHILWHGPSSVPSKATESIPIYANTFICVPKTLMGNFLSLTQKQNCWSCRVYRMFLPFLSSPPLPSPPLPSPPLLSFLFLLSSLSLFFFLSISPFFFLPFYTRFLCSSGSPRTCYVQQAGPRLTEICLPLPSEFWN